MKYEFIRAKSEDDRCAKSNCPYEKVEGATVCPRHGANKQIAKKARELMYEFTRERVRRNVNLLSADPLRYRLDEELAIMRLTLQDTINTISSESDKEYALFQVSDTIRNLVTTINKTAETCVQQSVDLGLLMTREDVLNQIQAIIDVVKEEIKDEEIILRIAERVDRVLVLPGLENERDSDSFKLDDPESLDRGPARQIQSNELEVRSTPLDEGDVEL